MKAAGIKVPSTVHKNSVVHSTRSTMYYVQCMPIRVPGSRVPRSRVPGYAGPQCIIPSPNSVVLSICKTFLFHIRLHDAYLWKSVEGWDHVLLFDSAVLHHWHSCLICTC